MFAHEIYLESVKRASEIFNKVLSKMSTVKDTANEDISDIYYSYVNKALVEKDLVVRTLGSHLKTYGEDKEELDMKLCNTIDEYVSLVDEQFDEFVKTVKDAR